MTRLALRFAFVLSAPLLLFWRPSWAVPEAAASSDQLRVIPGPQARLTTPSLSLPHKTDNPFSQALSVRLLDPAQLRASLRVLRTGSGRQFATRNDLLYVDGRHAHRQWGIYHPLATFRRDDASATAIRRIASAERIPGRGPVTTLIIRRLTQEIRIQDIAVPESEGHDLLWSLESQPLPRGLQARLLGTPEGHRYSSENQLVVLDKGQKDGLVPGCELALFPGAQSPDAEAAAWGQTADKIGVLLVLRAYPQFSLARIVQSSQPVSTDMVAGSPIVQAVTMTTDTGSTD